MAHVTGDCSPDFHSHEVFCGFHTPLQQWPGSQGATKLSNDSQTLFHADIMPYAPAALYSPETFFSRFY
jgi:hypothetical protein